MAREVKYKIIDTNIWLTDPEKAFTSFRPKSPDVETYLVIPMVVIEELDHIKKEQNTERGRNARLTSRMLMDLKQKHATASFSEAIPIEQNYFVKIVTGFEKELEYDFRKSCDVVRRSTLPTTDLRISCDNQILATLMAFDRKYAQKPKENPPADVELVAQDTNLIIKANGFGLKANYWEDIQVVKDLGQFYRGYKDIQLPRDIFAEVSQRFFSQSPNPFDGFASSDLGFQLQYSNEFVRVFCEDQQQGEVGALLGRFDFLKNSISLFAYTKSSTDMVRSPHKNKYPVKSISPRNYQQAFALEALLDDRVEIVHLIGPAGTGKTLLALAAALHKLEHEPNLQILVTKPIIPVGPTMGYLPGTSDEKLMPWNQGIVDNLYFIDNELDLEDMIKNKILQIQALEHVRGRSLHKRFYLIDESQNLTPHEVKTLITRMADGSKIVLAGDPYQVDNPALNTFSTGILHSSERMKQEPFSATVYLDKGERGKLATRASELL